MMQVNGKEGMGETYVFDILKTSTCRLWVQEVDHGNESGVEDEPDDVELPVE